MTIGWYTDNPLSRTVLESIPGIELYHINEFGKHVDEHGFPLVYKQNIFYGLLRGCGRAMHILQQSRSASYYYIDNGYFDALYVDKNKFKNMNGKFRVVKNGMHEVYPDKENHTVTGCQHILIIPPSPYSANFYDTTPEDWVYSIGKDLTEKGVQFKIRHKDSVTPLKESLAWCDGLITFNSMAVMNAIEMGIPVLDTHGIFRNYGTYPFDLMPVYDLQSLRDFYEPKQFTLEEFRGGACTFT